MTALRYQTEAGSMHPRPLKALTTVNIPHIIYKKPNVIYNYIQEICRIQKLFFAYKLQLYK